MITSAYIAGTNGYSDGIVLMLCAFDATARCVDQGGNKHPGAFAIYLKPWHSNIFEFIDLQLIIHCGGPTDLKAQGGLVQLCLIPYFKYPVGIDHRYSPRPGEEPKDEVHLHGEPRLIKNLKDELKKTTADLCSHIVLDVQVLTTAHSAIIGCSGCNLINFWNKFNVQVRYPGSNSYKNAGELENVKELSDVPPANLVKVAGARASVEEAIEQLKVCCPLA